MNQNKEDAVSMTNEERKKFIERIHAAARYPDGDVAMEALSGEDQVRVGQMFIEISERMEEVGAETLREASNDLEEYHIAFLKAVSADPEADHAPE